jgi:hypothetical protein
MIFGLRNLSNDLLEVWYWAESTLDTVASVQLWAISAQYDYWSNEAEIYHSQISGEQSNKAPSTKM